MTVETRIEQRGSTRTEKQIASELRNHPNIEKMMFEQVLEPHLIKLESLGTPDIDVQKVYLQQTTAFLFRSSTGRALQTKRLETLYADHKHSSIPSSEKPKHDGAGITLEHGIEYPV